MASKEELLRLLDRAYKTEEIIVLRLKEKLLIDLLWSAIPPEKRREGRKYLETLYEQSYRHAEILGTWRLRILRGEINDY